MDEGLNTGASAAGELVLRVGRALWLAGSSCAAKDAVWASLSPRDREPYLRGALAVIAELREQTPAIMDAALDDFQREQVATCEGCGAPLYGDDDFLSDEYGVYGCWAAMTDPPVEDRPCYAERVGKTSCARTESPAQ